MLTGTVALTAQVPNSERVQVNRCRPTESASFAGYRFSSKVILLAVRSTLFRDPFVDLLEVIGHAIRAFVRRFGPLPDPWDLSVNVTGGRLLTPPVRRRLVDSG